jgi:hypothetical protein
MADQHPEQELHERLAIDLRHVLWGSASIICGTVLAVLIAYFLWQRWRAPNAAQGLDEAGIHAMQESASPFLQSAPQQERARYEAQKQRLLESWEWTDRAGDLARIPVEVAMQIAAARDAQAHGGR